ncbi:MAG: hypothetical protein JW881_02920 [Spirochaetales bacterium]|nr:hypothetical protein [Spirochaetales bacterium]
MRQWFFLFLIIVLLPGCGAFNTYRVTIGTNIPEILAYSETFNASNEKYRIEMLYHPDPQMMLGEKETPPDLVIGENLWAPSNIHKFKSLDGLFKEKQLDEGAFYPNILEPGKDMNQQRLLPLCFNLPVVLYKKTSALEDNTDMYMNLETLKTQSLQFIQSKGDRLLKMGFSPFWNIDFLYHTAVLYHTGFRTEDGETLLWNADALTRAVAFLKNWMDEIPGGYTAERSYSRKYLNAPPYQLVNDKNIQYFLLDSKEMFRIPREKLQAIDFKWLSYENGIPVYDNIIFLGIPLRAENPEGAQAFIRWIFNRENQGKLMEINHFKRLDNVFGIAGGFSSLMEVSNTLLPKHYPLFIGHIPPPDSLIFPGPLPDHWDYIKRETIIPWISEAIVTENFNKKLEDQLKYFAE